MSRNYSKIKQIGTKRPTYKKNRASTKGKTKYEIYLNARQKLRDQGYTLDEGSSEAEFLEDYAGKSLKHDKNIIRDLARQDIIFTKTKRQKTVIPALEQLQERGLKVKGVSYGPEGISITEKFDRLEWFNTLHNLSKEGKLEKSMTRKVKDDTKRGWHYLWEEDFYRGSVFY